MILGRSASIFLLCAWALASGCNRSESSSTTSAAPSSTAGARGSSTPAGGIRFVKAGAGDVAPIVQAERVKASAEGRDLIVYVGAKWCEPCQRFHHAAESGTLDTEFPKLTIVEFDLDEDRDRINAAGYTSKLIPLFVRPGPDGRASDARFEGSIKGDRAVANIAPRLHRLLEN